MPIEVPNEFPTAPRDDLKIAFVGEAPGKDEEQMKRPFVGPSGNIFSQCANNAGILRSSCFVGNIAQVRPPADNLSRLSWDSWQIQQGLTNLKRDLNKFDPNLVVLMGASAVKAAGEKHSVTEMRGTLFKCHDLDSPFYGRKCLVTIHPAMAMRQWSYVPLLAFDMNRAKEEGGSPELQLPERHFDLHLSPDEICRKLDEWPAGQVAAIDIEGGIDPETFNGISCMSIAESPQYAFIIDWKNMRKSVMPQVFDAYHRWMRRNDVPKVAQNFLYELMCCGWRHKTPIGNIYWDTMLSGWEIYPELPKGLGTQASIWTREPYYKFERKIMDDETHNAYCCKDTTVTYEIFQAHQKWMESNPEAKGHFEFNQQLLPAFAYMQMKGIRYDQEQATAVRNELGVEMDELQTRIDLISGSPLNVNSPKQMVECLYKRMGFQPQYKKERGRKTNKLTADTPALLALMKKHDSDLVYYILKWRQLEGVRKQLDIRLDEDQRIRASYNPVGTETGRLTCYGSNTGSGYNLQTTTKRLRTLFRADEGHYMFQVDLSGADGLTVAAHSQRLGDVRMMEDYKRGVKPAKVISAMYIRNDRSLASLDSDTLFNVIEETEIPVWLYNAAKAVQHGSSYGMGKITMSGNILKQSWKHSGEPVHVAPKDCELLQQLFFARYIGVQRWQNWIKTTLAQKSELSCASGHVRRFFGRPNDNQTYQAALSHEPQANTTYATNLALHNLWHDAENRNEHGLIIQPLHQVHDAIVGQFPINREEWAVQKLKDYFSNTLTIAEQELVIPFEGEYGEYWGDDSAGIIQL